MATQISGPTSLIDDGFAAERLYRLCRVACRCAGTLMPQAALA